MTREPYSIRRDRLLRGSSFGGGKLDAERGGWRHSSPITNLQLLISISQREKIKSIQQRVVDAIERACEADDSPAESALESIDAPQPVAPVENLRLEHRLLFVGDAPHVVRAAAGRPGPTNGAPLQGVVRHAPPVGGAPRGPARGSPA